VSLVGDEILPATISTALQNPIKPGRLFYVSGYCLFINLNEIEFLHNETGGNLKAHLEN
jgi:hypothetical protein